MGWVVGSFSSAFGGDDDLDGYDIDRNGGGGTRGWRGTHHVVVIGLPAISETAVPGRQ